MAKLPLTDLTSLENETSALAAMNANFDAISEAFDNTYSLDGTQPNQLGSTLDANGNSIINVAAPVNPGDVARLVDITSGVVVVNGTTLPSVTGNAGKFLRTDGTNLLWYSITGVNLIAANNLSDVVSVVSARSNLGLTSAATTNLGTSGSCIPLLSTANTWTLSQTFSSPIVLSLGGQVTGGELRLSSTPTSLSPDSAGFRGAPQNVQSNNYTFVLTDSGAGVTQAGSTAVTWTIPTNASVAFPLHTTIVVDNQGSGVVTIAPASGVTLRSNGSGTSANKTLNQYTVATLYQVATNVWVSMGI